MSSLLLFRRICPTLLLFLLTPACQSQAPEPLRSSRPAPLQVEDATPEACLDPGDPVEAAYYATTGPTEGQIILPNGRSVTPAGVQVQTGVFPMNIIAGPNSRYFYVTSDGDGTNSVQQIDVTTNSVVSTLSFHMLFHGLALSSDGTTLYATGGKDDALYVIDVGTPGLALRATWNLNGYPTGLALSPDDSRLLVTANLEDEVYEMETSTGYLLRTIPTGKMPYHIIYSPDGRYAYTSLWSRRQVSVIDLQIGKTVDSFKTGKNPAGLAMSPAGDRLYVASSDGDAVEAFDLATRRQLAEVKVGSYSAGLHGASPNSLALNVDGSLLYVANAGDNAIEVYDSSALHYLGAIPTAWYPSAVAITPDGAMLAAVNGKGEGAGPTRNNKEASKLMNGTVSLVNLPWTSSRLEDGDAQVTANNSRPMTLHEINCAGKMFPIPSPGMSSPIEHVVLILRENKTYDAYLGDLEVGDGDPNYTLYGEDVTPNTHELARQYTLLDNFYTDSEDSDQGHLWATAAFVNDYTERNNAVGRFVATGLTFASDSPGRYIFTALREAGIDWVNYGEVVGLEAATMHNIDWNYPGVFFNLSVKDQKKAEYVVTRIRKGVMPPFTFLSLPDDHTNGTSAGKLSPESMVSDNDYGVGLVVDAISKSPFWASTVIFIFEDDPQSGADHVEAHRSPAVVVSPWTKRQYVSSVHYAMPSIYRTMEMILDFPPLTQYDAMATPMYDCFTAVPDYTPYEALPRQIPDTYNTSKTVGAAESAKMDFSGPDRARGLSKVIWRYIKGTEPPPLLGLAEEDDDD